MVSEQDNLPEDPTTKGSQETVGQDARTQAKSGAPVLSSRSRDLEEIIGTVIDRYKIESLVGEGGFGAVYAAEHTLMRRRVAFKTLHKDLAQDKAVLRRFLREGQVANRFTHEHAIEIYDFGPLPDGGYFMAMEFLYGLDMRETLKKRGALPVNEVFDIMLMTLAGLQAAHNGGVIHRDLKPDNLVLEKKKDREDYVKILDFGIAKLIEIDESEEGLTMVDEAKQMVVEADGAELDFGSEMGDGAFLTQVGSFFGTPEYGSPEQCAGEKVDFRSDIYSMAVIFYEALSGSLPFLSKTPQGYLAQHMVATPRPIAQVNPDLKIPPEVEALILKGLEKSPDDRYQTPDEMAQAIIEVAKKCKIKVTATSILEDRSKAVTMAASILAATAILGMILFFIMRETPLQILSRESAEGIANKEFVRVWEKVRARSTEFKDNEMFDELLKNVEENLNSFDLQQLAELKTARDDWATKKIRDYDRALEGLEKMGNAHPVHDGCMIHDNRKLDNAVKTIREKKEQDAREEKDLLDKNAVRPLKFRDWDKLQDLIRKFPVKIQGTRAYQDVLAFKRRIERDARVLLEDEKEQAGKQDFIPANEFYIEQQKKRDEGGDIDYDEVLRRYTVVSDDHNLEYWGDRANEVIIEVILAREVEAESKAKPIRDYVDAIMTALDDNPAQVENLAWAPETSKALEKFEEFKWIRYRKTEVAVILARKRLLEVVYRAQRNWRQQSYNYWNVNHQKGLVEKGDNLFRIWMDHYLTEEATNRINKETALVMDEATLTPLTSEAHRERNTLKIVLRLHENMVPVDGGKFTPGADNVFANVIQYPRPMTIKPFLIDRVEVSNEQYWVFLRTNGLTNGHQIPDGWPSYNLLVKKGLPEELKKMPVTYVTYEDAAAFARWAGKRLPTEFEWEMAACFELMKSGRGKNWEYSWGEDKWRDGAANWYGRTLKPVNSNVDFASPWGCFNMAGNAAEWTQSSYKAYPGGKMFIFQNYQDHKVIRGSHCGLSSKKTLRSVWRAPWDPKARHPFIGFRCIKDNDAKVPE